MDPRYNTMGTENELAGILSHYSSEYVYDIVTDQIDKIKSGFVGINVPPNVVSAWEQNFKAILERYGSEGTSEVQRVREETYKEIITIICDKFNLNFTISDVDYYSAALTLYDFFVCNFTRNITSFFAKYLYKERGAIYDSMDLSEDKKKKDSSTIYGKHMYKDIKIAVINANLVKILGNVCASMEFDFQTLINTIMDDKNYARYILSLISDKSNIFNDIMVPLVNMNMPEYVTGIRFMIQEIASAHDQIIYTNANSGIEDNNGGEE